jgi:hypothetical protein
MAAGEYVSVHSQADTEQAGLKREHGAYLWRPRRKPLLQAARWTVRGVEPIARIGCCVSSISTYDASFRTIACRAVRSFPCDLAAESTISVLLA